MGTVSFEEFTPGEGSRGTLAILVEDAPSTRGFLLLEGSGDFRGYKASSCKISLRPFLLSIFPSFPNAPKPPHTRPSPSFRCKLAILAAPVGCAGPLITPPPPPPLSLRSRKLSHTPHSGDRLPQSIFKHPPCPRSPKSSPLEMLFFSKSICFPPWRWNSGQIEREAARALGRSGAQDHDGTEDEDVLHEKEAPARPRA